MNVVITGANRGIGAEMAARYRAQGHDVLGTARDGSCDVTLDVSDPNAFGALREAVQGRVVDLLICNAGVFLDKGHSLDNGYDAATWAQTYAVNVTGVFLTVQTLMPNLRVAATGKIAIVSSLMASQVNAPGGAYVYRSSKAAVLNLGRNLAKDLRGEGIAVGVYHPGWVRTDMGGPSADIDEASSADGLMSRFSELDIASTGCFKAWDGVDLPM